MEQPKIITNFEYNGASFYFDAEDVECMEKYAAAAQKFEKASKELDADATEEENALESKVRKMRLYCQNIRTLFDDILGPGAGLAICGERLNARTHTDAYAAFIEFAYEQADKGMASRTHIADLYVSRAENRRSKQMKK
ncbi:MAG: hypothetical protein J6Y26_03050 [Lachnospiraceae bacterium]|nr:hypothetical protein [Lachnospiraceae bacterium]